MTEVAFHFSAPDKLGYTCRLLRKAVARGARVAVTAEPEMLRALDHALWTFAPLEFVPHCAQEADASVLAASPIVLCKALHGVDRTQVLVNLAEGVPDGFERFERLIEIVTLDEADRRAARKRWMHYSERGYAIVRHDAANPAGQSAAS